MNSDELRQAIEGPALKQALYFEPPELVGKLIDAHIPHLVIAQIYMAVVTFRFPYPSFWSVANCLLYKHFTNSPTVSSLDPGQLAAIRESTLLLPSVTS